MKWYKHDSNAHRDAKLKKLRIRYGMEGYGLYWYCLELIADNVDVGKITFELEEDAEVISHETGIHYEQVQEMMTHMCDLKLFENNGGTITCLKLAKRLDQSMTSNPKMRDLISSIRENHDSVMMKSDLVMQDKTRLDKIREYKRGAKRAPPAYEPSEKLLDTLADETNFNTVELQAMLREMKDHEFRNAKKDWDAVFRNWVRRQKSYREKDAANRRNTESFGDIHARNRKRAGLD